MWEHESIPNHQRMLCPNQETEELPTIKGQPTRVALWSREQALHDFIQRQSRTEAEGRMGTLRALRPPPNSQEAEDKPPSLLGPAEETRPPPYQKVDSLADTQSSSLNSSANDNDDLI